MGSSGIKMGGNTIVRRAPIATSITKVSDVENKGMGDVFGEGDGNEYAVTFDSNGEIVGAYLGNEHSVGIDNNALNIPGGVLTHRHPDNKFGGTLSMQDLKVLAKSQLGEIRAFSTQGQVYSVVAGPNADKAKLLSWVNKNQGILNKNFQNSYRSSYRNARGFKIDANGNRVSTVIKTGKNAGKVKIASGRVNGRTQYKYVNPMTPQQADKYARTYSVGQYERAYRKALSQYGFTYNKTKSKNA